jgi:L-alanine-DL-glutamate epimerase-like enolase superfamily enzyme
MSEDARIETVQAFLASYPWSGYFKFLGASRGHTVVFVKITSEDGTVGWGQSLPVPKWSYEAPETALAAIEHYYSPALVGHDARDIKGAHVVMDRALAPSFTTGMPITRAGLDIALHDLKGKLLGKSLAELWGRSTGSPVRLNWTVNVRTLDELDTEIETAHARGYHGFNVKIAPDPDFDVALLRRIRQLEPDGFLWADANGGYDPATALEFAPKLAEIGVDVFEAPLRPNQIRGYQALKKQGALPITMDEGVVSPVEAEEFIRLGMVDGLTIKVSRCGGLAPAKRMIELVLDAGLFWLGSGLTDPDVSLAASLALYGTFDLDKSAALNGPQFLQADVLTEPITIDGDIAHVPTGSGVGVEVDETKVQELMKER